MLNLQLLRQVFSPFLSPKKKKLRPPASLSLEKSTCTCCAFISLSPFETDDSSMWIFLRKIGLLSALICDHFKMLSITKST